MRKATLRTGSGKDLKNQPRNLDQSDQGTGAKKYIIFFILI